MSEPDPYTSFSHEENKYWTEMKKSGKHPLDGTLEDHEKDHLIADLRRKITQLEEKNRDLQARLKKRG